MALLATPVASHLWGTTFGGFGAAAIAIGSRDRATTDLVGAFTASSVISPTSTISVAAASTFPAATTAATATGEHSMVSVGPLLPFSRESVVPLSNSLNDFIAADTITRCQAPCLHLVFGRQNVDEDDVQHVVVEGQSCCTHFCCKILDPAHLLEEVATWLYIKPKGAGKGRIWPPSFEGRTTQGECRTLPSAR